MRIATDYTHYAELPLEERFRLVQIAFKEWRRLLTRKWVGLPTKQILELNTEHFKIARAMAGIPSKYWFEYWYAPIGNVNNWTSRGIRSHLVYASFLVTMLYLNEQIEKQNKESKK